MVPRAYLLEPSPQDYITKGKKLKKSIFINVIKMVVLFLGYALILPVQEILPSKFPFEYRRLEGLSKIEWSFRSNLGLNTNMIELDSKQEIALLYNSVSKWSGSIKGQLISKGLFVFFNSPKKHFQVCFFGRIEGTKISFRE